MGKEVEKLKKQIKIYSFNRLNVKDGVITSDDLEENKITLNESFLTYALECYKNEKLENGQLVDEIIKVMLPSNEEKAKKEWDEGLTFNNNKYFAWFATTNGMKKEELGICETLFIREDMVEFTKEFEDLISLGKFKEIGESKKQVCVNKDILSRISLGTSSSQIAGDMPNFIVLPQATYRIIKDYKTVEKFTKEVEDKDGNKKEVIDYNLIDYHFDNDIDVFDGGGIATPGVFKQIQQELNIKYPLEFAIIRGYGLGIKGLITKFDIIGYLRPFFKGATDYCRIKNGHFQLLDRWNQWQTVTKNTILLNDSMVKLAKYFDNMEEYQEKLSDVDEKYKDIINKLYVTKVNKADKDITDYRRTNYQLMSALVLSKQDYESLTREDIKAYRKILKSFVKDEEGNWQIDIDTIRLFFKNIVNSEDEEEIADVLSNVASKCEELLNVSEDFVKLKYVKNNLVKLIEKKCRELALGKFTVKSKYKYIAVCPISYMNFAMYRDQGTNGLQEGLFYSGDCQDGDTRTISRNPLCAYSEVHNVNYIRNELLDNYLSQCKELIYFNQKSDILALMSSADADGDALLEIDNEIIRNAVVVPEDGKYFINKNDGDKVEMEYNSENRFIATYRASGNLIGNIALKAASINSNSQQTYDYYDTVNKEFVIYSKFDDKEEIKTKLDSGELIRTYKVPELHKDHMRQRFYENEKDIYIVLYNAMVSIDAPKTLFFPSKADMQIINDKYPRKAWFLQYKEQKKDVKIQHYQYTFGLLDAFSKEVERVLLKEINKIVTKFDNKVELIQTKLINGDYNIGNYNDCFEELQVLYTSYVNERKSTDKECWKKIKKEENYREEMIDNYSWSNWEEEIYFDTVAKLRTDKKKKYKKIDAKYIVLADELMQKYDIATIANAIGNLKNCTEDFIINLFFPVFHYLNEKLQSDRYIYIKDEDGDIRYLHENYRKIIRQSKDNFQETQSLHLEEKKRLKVTDLNENIRAKILDGTIGKTIENELKDKKYMNFDIKLDGENIIFQKNKVDVLQIFKEWTQIKQYNLHKCVSAKVENLGKVNNSSLAMTLTELDVVDE